MPVHDPSAAAGHAAAYLHTVATVRPPVGPAGPGRFLPESFAELVGCDVHVPGLDPGHRHVLVGVDVADDGGSARLSIHTEQDRGHDLTSHLNIAAGSPAAVLEVVDADSGEVLHVGEHPAPVTEGEVHRIGARHVAVVGTEWPHRDVETGCVQPHPETGEYPRDVQRVRVREVAGAQVTPSSNSDNGG